MELERERVILNTEAEGISVVSGTLYYTLYHTLYHTLS